MSQELAKIERSVKAQDHRLTVEDVKRYLCPKASDQELFLFVQLCRSQGLDPWRKEAYLIKYDERSPASIVVGKDLFTRRAQANPKFAGFKSGIIVYRKDPDDKDAKWEEVYVEGSYKRASDRLAGGWAEVFLKGYKTPIKVTVSFEEYNRNQAMWNKMPCTMIRKVALVQTLREAFPEELGGLIDESEIAVRDEPQGQVSEGPVTPEIREECEEVVNGAS
jgi:phage recombination protein Bet